MQNSIISQQELRKSNTEQQSSASFSSSQRRPSLWDKIAKGCFNASEADVAGIRKADAQGFAPVGAKFDEGFGNSALWETTLSGPTTHNTERQRERNILGEDALRQMS